RYVTGFTYDMLGNITEVDYPSHPQGVPEQVVYSYDDRAQVVGVGTTATPTAYASYTYNADGTTNVETLNPGGAGEAKRQFDYSPAAWPQAISATFQGGQGTFATRRDFTAGGYSPTGGDVGYYNGLVARLSSTYAWSRGATAPSASTYRFA